MDVDAAAFGEPLLAGDDEARLLRDDGYGLLATVACGVSEAAP